VPDGPKPELPNTPSRTLPVFPLGSVLVPGLIMPLHIFEPRYRRLVHDLLERPEEDRDFVIVAIRDGLEVGTQGVRALHRVGTVASLREVTPHEDGRFDIVTVGTDRVVVSDLIEDLPYLQAQVTVLPEFSGPEADAQALKVRQRFNAYRMMLSGGSVGNSSDDLPDDPRVLSYLVAAAMVLELPDRQALLEMEDDSQRLALEFERLKFELSVFRTIPSLPAIDLRASTPSNN
jgi:Lon protease-like protein